MAARIQLSTEYQAARQRVTDLVTGLLAMGPAAAATPVPATPGWSVHDVVAHLTGVAQDIVAGAVPEQGPTPQWTAGHVARGRDVPTEQLLRRWAEVATAAGERIDAGGIWPPVMDTGAHEHDLRGAVGDRSARDTAVVQVGGYVLLRSLQVPAPLRVLADDREVLAGPPAVDGPVVVLRTSLWEAFRWRLGRRSRAQLAAMDWSGDPGPFLDHLCLFGPADADLIE